MSNPRYFIEDICALKAGDMECMDIAKSEEGLEPQDENHKVEKLKESHLLLKKKLSLSHELIKQYNDKIKECQDVTTELETVKDNLKKLTQKSNSSLAKIMQLELENKECKKQIENSSKTISEKETKISADQQHLQQLVCKIQELEHKENMNGKFTKKEELLKEKVKSLETELKATKDSHKMEIKQMEVRLKSLTSEVAKKQTKKQEIKMTHDKSTCTVNEVKPVLMRPETMDKCTLTNEFYSIKDDPYPLFCSKCLIKLDPIPLDQILSQMSTCPTLITGVTSPLKKSETSSLESSPRTLRQMESLRPEAVADDRNDFTQSYDPVRRVSDVSKSDFQKLEQKLCLLERKLHKKMRKEVQGRNPCCGFQYPNNCHLGPYPNLFQPRTMVPSQADLFQYQNWQGGLRSRKRSRRVSVQKSNRRGIKSRKKRRLDDGTSEWNVDSVPSRDSIDSDHSNASDNDSEPSSKPTREEFPPLRFPIPKNKPAKQRKKSEACSSPRRRKQTKLTTLFSPTHSTSPRLHGIDRDIHTDEESYNETRIDSFGDEEMIENGNRPPEYSIEYETVECVSKKRGRGVKKPVKTSAKSSLVTKIRNLKKNCNSSKPSASKAVPVINNIKNSISNQILGAKVPMSAGKNNISHIEAIKNDQPSNSGEDYCPVKKQRIAHSVRKLGDNSVCKGNKNSTEVPEVNQQKDAVKDNLTDSTQTEPVAIIEKLDDCTEEINIIRKMANSKLLVPIQRRNSTEDILDANCSQAVKKPAVKQLEVEPVGEIAADKTQIHDTSETGDSVVNKTLNIRGKAVPLQPCVIIPRIYLGIEGVEDPCNTTNDGTDDDESLTNLTLDTEKMSSSEASLRILRSSTKKTKVLSKDEITNANEDAIEKTSTLNNSEAISRTMKMELSHSLGNIYQQEPSDNELSESISDVNDTSISVKSDKSADVNNEVMGNEKTGLIGATRIYKKRVRIEKASPVSPMRELRSRKIMLSPSENSETKNNEETNEEMSNETPLKTVQLLGNINAQCNEGHGPKALIKQYFTKRANSQKEYFYNKKRRNEMLQGRREKLVLNELTKLADDGEWTKAVLLATVERLSKFKTHTIAKCIIDFLVARTADNEPLDRTHTPPAPLLSRTQQRILTTLVALNRTWPNIIQLVQAGIEFRLFRLGHAPEVNVVEELTRVFTALARIQKDRERVRILCCDALYCLGLKAMPLIYVILVSWPEVFPMAGSSSDPVLLCLTDSIMTQTGDTAFPKFFALKKLLKGYYSYEDDGTGGNALTKNLMTALREKRENGLDTAIVLLAKKKGPVWTYKNIIQGGLLQMIIQKAHPSIYDAFCLLGYLMRSFPVDDKNGAVKNILEQLCALMESGEGSIEQQEGVATALLSLYRHKQDVVAKTILKWEPSEPLSETTSRQLRTVFESHPPTWWYKILQKNCIK